MYQQTRIAKHFRFVRTFRAKVTDSLNEFRLKLIVYSTKNICGDMEILIKKHMKGLHVVMMGSLIINNVKCVSFAINHL